jgi:hypothetical protein
MGAKSSKALVDVPCIRSTDLTDPTDSADFTDPVSIDVTGVDGNTNVIQISLSRTTLDLKKQIAEEVGKDPYSLTLFVAGMEKQMVDGETLQAEGVHAGSIIFLLCETMTDKQVLEEVREVVSPKSWPRDGKSLYEIQNWPGVAAVNLEASTNFKVVRLLLDSSSTGQHSTAQAAKAREDAAKECVRFIPPSLGSMGMLAFLDLRLNNLTGRRIPQPYI